MGPPSRFHRAPARPRAVVAMAAAAVAVGAAALALLMGAIPAAAQPIDDDEPVDIAALLADLDLFPDGQLDEQRLARFTDALSQAGPDPQDVPESARFLATAAQQFQHLRQQGAAADSELRRAYLSALTAELAAAGTDPGYPAVRANLDLLQARVQQYEADQEGQAGGSESGSLGGSVREAPSDSIASRRGPCIGPDRNRAGGPGTGGDPAVRWPTGSQPGRVAHQPSRTGRPHSHSGRVGFTPGRTAPLRATPRRGRPASVSAGRLGRGVRGQRSSPVPGGSPRSGGPTHGGPPAQAHSWPSRAARAAASSWS